MILNGMYVYGKTSISFFRWFESKKGERAFLRFQLEFFVSFDQKVMWCNCWKGDVLIFWRRHCVAKRWWNLPSNNSTIFSVFHSIFATLYNRWQVCTECAHQAGRCHKTIFPNTTRPTRHIYIFYSFFVVIHCFTLYVSKPSAWSSLARHQWQFIYWGWFGYTIDLTSSRFLKEIL